MAILLQKWEGLAMINAFERPRFEKILRLQESSAAPCSRSSRDSLNSPSRRGARLYRLSLSCLALHPFTKRCASMCGQLQFLCEPPILAQRAEVQRLLFWRVEPAVLTPFSRRFCLCIVVKVCASRQCFFAVWPRTPWWCTIGAFPTKFALLPMSVCRREIVSKTCC